MPAHASKFESDVLRRVAAIKNAVVADAIGHDESHVSRIISGERGLRLHEIEPFLSALGLLVIEHQGEMRTISADEHEALKLLARKGLDK